MLGLMAAYLKPEGIEKVDEYTVVLNLYSPSIAVPAHLYHYPAQIMNHRTFEGDFLKDPVGTGPFVIEEYFAGERVVLKARQRQCDRYTNRSVSCLTHARRQGTLG
jgi:peptide/nickel transport system substrate-binding protein